MGRVLPFRLRHIKPGVRLRGDLEDTVLYVSISLVLGIFVLWYAVDIFQLTHAHRVVHNAAEAAATSAVTQATYSPNTVLGGSGFGSGVNENQATSVANTTFQFEEQALNLSQVVTVSNPTVGFPAPNKVSYSVTVSYVPRGVYAGIDVLSALFNTGHIPPSPPTITWTEVAVAGQNQGGAVA